MIQANKVSRDLHNTSGECVRDLQPCTHYGSKPERHGLITIHVGSFHACKTQGKTWRDLVFHALCVA